MSSHHQARAFVEIIIGADQPRDCTSHADFPAQFPRGSVEVFTDCTLRKIPVVTRVLVSHGDSEDLFLAPNQEVNALVMWRRMPTLEIRKVLRDEPFRFGWEPSELPGWLAARGFDLVRDWSDLDIARARLPREHQGGFEAARGGWEFHLALARFRG